MLPKQHSSEIKHCCVDHEGLKQNTHYCRSSCHTIVLDRGLKKRGTSDGGPQS